MNGICVRKSKPLQNCITCLATNISLLYWIHQSKANNDTKWDFHCEKTNEYCKYPDPTISVMPTIGLPPSCWTAQGPSYTFFWKAWCLQSAILSSLLKHEQPCVWIGCIIYSLVDSFNQFCLCVSLSISSKEKTTRILQCNYHHLVCNQWLCDSAFKSSPFLVISFQIRSRVSVYFRS